jgi:SPX domain protein involved in polyphosphate accumulation
METRIGELENEVEGYSRDGKPMDPRVKTRIIKDLDEIVEEIKELEKFSRINFTGFMKVPFQLVPLNPPADLPDCQKA